MPNRNDASAGGNARLRRIVMLSADASLIGGVAGRVRRTLRHAGGRAVAYVSISRQNAAGFQCGDHYDEATQGAALLAMIAGWRADDTVFVTHNNMLREFSAAFRTAISRFPLLYVGAGQLAFMIQDSHVLADIDYVRDFRAAKLVSLSDADILFQRQLGIHGQAKLALPIETRADNPYDVTRNRQPGYVGIVRFATKGTERLIGVAAAMRDAGLGPLKVFTTRSRNSPDLDAFLQLIAFQRLEEQFDIVMECRDPSRIYDTLSFLLLPSKKESFGNVILEAYSHGVPVISTTYAPGPAELVDHGRTGFLLDEFSGEAVVELLGGLGDERRMALSAAAFARHRDFGMDRYFAGLESIAAAALAEFEGVNTQQVFPSLKAIVRLAAERDRAIMDRDSLIADLERNSGILSGIGRRRIAALVPLRLRKLWARKRRQWTGSRRPAP